MKTIIGIDNGVTGTISILHNDGVCFTHGPMPVRSEQSYTKTKQNITRVDWLALFDLLKPWDHDKDCLVAIERPMVNPGRMKATFSALRCLESVLVVVEMRGLAYRYFDSKEWQRTMLPKGLWRVKQTQTGRTTAKADSKELKSAAVDIARRLFPYVQTKDADSLLLAEYVRRLK